MFINKSLVFFFILHNTKKVVKPNKIMDPNAEMDDNDFTTEELKDMVDSICEKNPCMMMMMKTQITIFSCKQKR